MSKESHQYKVYLISCPILGSMRYIGLTYRTIEERLDEHIQDKTNKLKVCWIKSIRSKGFQPKITLLMDNLSEEEARSYEVWWGGFLWLLLGDSLTNDLNCLGNLPPKAKKGHKKRNTEKMSESARKRFTKQEERDKISKTRKQKQVAKGEKNPMFGKKRPEVGLKNKEMKGKKIAKLNKKTKEIITIYSSVAEGARENRLDRANISKCCYNDKKTAGGFYWRFV